MAFEDDFSDISLFDSPPASVQQPAESREILKKIIKTGNIQFESEDVQKDYEVISALLKKHEAYIENEDQSKTAYRTNYDLTIRVSPRNFDNLIDEISGLGIRLDSKSIGIADVTEHYYDLKARIQNKKALEARYVEILKKASTVKDVLEIERNLNEVRTDIELLEGQFKYLSKQIEFSTISLAFYEVLPYSSESSQRKNFGTRLSNSLNSGWQGFLTFLVAFIGLWPFIFLIVGGIYGLRKIRARRKKK